MTNIDYSKSAVNLNNPITIQPMLELLKGAQATLEERRAELKEKNKELMAEIERRETEISNLITEIKLEIDRAGSYQDLTNGFYAVKQRKVSYSYDPSRFETKYPEFAPAVIQKAVNAVKLNGLIKGGLLKMEDLLHPDIQVAKESESFAYIIKTEAK